ncbi:hypothetical protein ACSQ76_12215 [Roseovarius sp. B08]|uniref:hypothetical protein n=1 Tax=Roseovarius sp. B08 TaxID=3449223 RepID=UPI003EDC1551
MGGDIFSFFAGLALMFFGSLVLIAFWPRRSRRESGSEVLSLAIFLAALAGVSNAFYWQVLTALILEFRLATIFEVRAFGKWLDLLFKGGAAYAMFLHLKALRAQLSPNERKKWSVLEMPFYPNRRLCLVRLMRRWRKF